MPRQDTATTPPDDAVVDLIEEISGAGVHILARRGAWYDGGPSGIGGTGTTPGSLHIQGVGVGVVVSSLFERQGCYQVTSGVAVTGRTGLTGMIPIGADNGTSPAAANAPLRYRFSTLLIRTNPITALTGFGYGFRRTASLAFGITTPCIAVESITTLNGGNWTVFQTLVNAGPQTAVDTGVAGITRAYLEFVYDDTTNPRLQILLNGATVYDATGLANLPSLANAEVLFNGFYSGNGGVLVGVGQVDRVRQCRFRVQTLPGFPI